MKSFFRSLSVVALLLVVTAFAGCSLFQKQDVIPAASQEEKQLDKRTGTIQVQLDAATHAVKHILQTENGESIELSSLSVELDRYVGRKVQVEGMFEERENKLQVETITTLSEELGIKKNYVNGSMGVSFSYPANWNVDESSVAKDGILRIFPFNVSQIERDSIDAVTITRLDNPERKSAKDWLKLDEFFRPTKEAATAYSYQESVIGKQQYPAVKTFVESPYQVNFFVQREVNLYEIAFDSRQPEEKNINENAFYEMISSFDFVPFTDAAIGTVTAPTTVISTSTSTIPVLLLPSSEVTASNSQPTKYSDNAYLTQYEKALESVSTSITKFEFSIKDENADPTGVYITYTDGTDTKRVYGEYSDGKNPETYLEKATFSYNSTGGYWVLASGVDSGKGLMKVTINQDNSVSVVMAGMQLIESRVFKAKFQIPSKWYWSITPDGYAFDSKPLQAGKDAMLVLSNDPSKALAAGTSATTTSGKAIIEGVNSDKSESCINLKKTYCLIYNDPQLDHSIVLSILDSIIEN